MRPFGAENKGRGLDEDWSMPGEGGGDPLCSNDTPISKLESSLLSVLQSSIQHSNCHIYTVGDGGGKEHAREAGSVPTGKRGVQEEGRVNNACLRK